MRSATIDALEPPSIPIAVGIAVGLVASVVQSLGITIQRKSHILNQDQPESERVVEHKRPLWLLGFAIFLSSNILGSVFQIASLPVVILAPLGAVSLIWNAFFAHLILGDLFSLWLILGTFLIAAGAVLVAIFGILPVPFHDLEALLALFRRPQFITYFSLLGAVLLVTLVLTHIAEFSFRNQLQSPAPTPAWTTRQTPSEQTPLLPNDSKTPPKMDNMENAVQIESTRTLLAISYSSASGIISGMCLLFAKSGVELLLLTLGGQNQFWRWQAWMLLGGLVAFAVLQLWYLHKSLILADPTLVCPLAFCFYNISSIANSLVYYDQFSALSTAHMMLIILGAVILLLGVWSVSIPTGDRHGVDLGTFHDGEETAERESFQQFQPTRPGLPITQSLPPHLPSDLARTRSHRRVVTSPPLLRNITELDETASPSTSIPRSSTPPPEQEIETLNVSTYSRRRRFSLRSPSSQQDGFLQPPVSNPLAGFSIGLSPMSPGFALVPKKTTRMSFPHVVRQLRMRRAVSDSDMRTNEIASASGTSRDLEQSTTSIGEGSPLGVPSTARHRWKRLKALLYPD